MASEGTSKQKLGAGLGAIGGFLFLGGLKGVIVGMSLGYSLMSPKNEEEMELQDYNNYNRLKVVPLLIGTDMCSSTVMWIDNFRSEDTQDFMDKKKVKDELQVPATIYLAQIAYCFNEACFINYPWFNGTELGEILLYETDIIEDYFHLEFSDTAWPPEYSADPPIPTAAVNHTFLYYDGPLGTDFTINENSTNMGANGNIPTVKAECAYKAPYYFWGNDGGNKGEGGYTFDTDGYATRSGSWFARITSFLINSQRSWTWVAFGAEDGSNDHIYWLNNRGAFGIYNIYDKTVTLLKEQGEVSDGYYGGIDNTQYCVRTVGGYVYVLTCRNQYLSNVGGVEQIYHGSDYAQPPYPPRNPANTWTTNYTGYFGYNPDYSMEYDLFSVYTYSNEVTSIVKNARISVPYNSSHETFPALYLSSMEFSANYLYFICYQVDPYYIDTVNWRRHINNASLVGLFCYNGPYTYGFTSNQHSMGKMIILRFNKDTGEYIDIAGEKYFPPTRWVGWTYHNTQNLYLGYSGTSVSFGWDIRFSYYYIMPPIWSGFCYGSIVNDVVEFDDNERIDAGNNVGYHFWGKCTISGDSYVLYTINNDEDDDDDSIFLYKIPYGDGWDDRIELYKDDSYTGWLSFRGGMARCQTYRITPFNYGTEIFFKFKIKAYGIGGVDQLWSLWKLDLQTTKEIDITVIDNGTGKYLASSVDMTMDYGWPYDWDEWANCKYLIGSYNYAVSTYVDPAPTTALDITNEMMVQSSRDQLPKIQIAQEDRDYCLELVESSMNGIYIIEPRFLYSNLFSDTIKGYDLVSDILQTCRGFLSLCNGSLNLRIMKPDEVPVLYFGFDDNIFTSSQTSTYYNRVYADFSDYPDDYWNGDIGSAVVSGSQVEFFIKDQTSTYIELYDDLAFYFPSGVAFSLQKDNIKGGSFVYSKKSRFDKANRITLEYINRFDEYRTDVEEEDYVIGIEELGLRKKTYSMKGIKRSTQAKRMVTYLMDYEVYVNWMCSFDTDLVGYMVCVGDVVGVTHPLVDWQGKLFRIIQISELQDFECKIELEEYIPTIYHDYGSVAKGIQANSWRRAGVPGQVRRFRVIEDQYHAKLYFAFAEPSSNRQYWAGVTLYYRNSNGSWQLLGRTGNLAASVELASNIDKYTRMIPIDYSTMYLSFGSSGSFWIDNEEIYYNSATEDGFYNCIRGYNGTVATSHTAGSYIIYKSSNLFSVDVPRNMLPTTLPLTGTSATFMAVSFGMYGVPAPYDRSPTYTFSIMGYGYLPLPVSSLDVIETSGEYS